MNVNRELADFLRSRRDRLQPEDFGLPPGQRRSPGLRRAEVAQLAGISVDYYIRLEQGKSGRPSATVLDSLARALRLSVDERDHLFRLAGSDQGLPRRAATTERVRPSVHRILETLGTTPAYVIGRRMDVLAWNPMAAALIMDFGAVPPGQRNMLWHAFCDPAARQLYVDWGRVARQGIAHLRMAAARNPDCPMIAGLVGELSVKSEEFRTWWARHDVQDRRSGRKEFAHPVVGRLSLDYDALQLPDGPDQHLITYTAPADSPSRGALDLLAVVGATRMGAAAGVLTADEPQTDGDNVGS
ncbi:helix-turn-helix domain-containing protein [Actinomadura oligospora]|uniref:helix-turn-helix domain-containing protein n=1 Tax=Actinomadura oligospora TaxID=111804 RepID=UPI0004B8E6D9|nr:helix-turn-helix transcriptional regulator [Actinomadura oligospora]